MTTATTIGFAVLEATTVTDDAGNVVAQTSTYRQATAAEAQQILSAAQKGQPTTAVAPKAV